jgi:hypothetical protein
MAFCSFFSISASESSGKVFTTSPLAGLMLAIAMNGLSERVSKKSNLEITAAFLYASRISEKINWQPHWSDHYTNSRH